MDALTNTQIFARIATQAQLVNIKVNEEGLKAAKSFASDMIDELETYLDSYGKNGAGFLWSVGFTKENVKVRSNSTLLSNMQTVINKANEQIRKAQ